MRDISTIVVAIGVFVFGALVVPSPIQASECEIDSSSIAAHIFDMSDENEDGFLSPAEFSDAGLERYGVGFNEFDANSDGETSVDEYFDLFELHHPPREMI